MTTITHSLVGGALGCGALALAPEVFGEGYSKGFWIAIFIGVSNLPDIDVALLLLPRTVRRGNPLFDHRGITHGLPALVLVSLALAAALSGDRGTPTSMCMFGWFAGTIGLHLLCDMLDGSTGVCLFAPFTGRKHTAGYRINDDIPLDVLSTGEGRMAFIYGVATETLLITLPASTCIGILSAVRYGV